MRGLSEILETLDQVNVGFRSATEPFDTTSPTGRMMVQMLGVFAEFERATIIDRVIAGMDRKASLGGWCGGVAPYGYRAVKGEGRLSVDELEAPLVPVLFDLYANQHLGSHAVAHWLNEAGLVTRSGRPWSFKSVLTVLRSRVYLGQVRYRDGWCEGSHPALIDEELFDAAQVILTERAEDVTKRATNASDYLLTGLVVCSHCGQRFSGTRATGRHETYRYYTCGSRQRYGTKTCDADRLPADVLDSAIIESLLAAYEDSNLFRAAVGEAQDQARAGHSRHDDELRAVTNELAKVDASIDRYLRAFESGSMPEVLCGERVKELATRATVLRARSEELSEKIEQADITCASPEELSTLRDRVSEAIAGGSPALVKSLLQALIHEIRVDSRNAIQPVFRVPLAGDVMAAVRFAHRPRRWALEDSNL
ncbi:MAG: recombinase family protein [Acidimicrobiales bacterium]